jgi:conjugative transfer signal peptidase TraF
MSARPVILGMMLTSATLTIAPAVTEFSPVFIWNASGSVPIGLYRVFPEDHLRLTDLVAVMPPEPIATFLAQRNYLPRGVPLLKRVLALPGKTVCRIRLAVLVDCIEMASARERDRRGRPLPDWQGCRTIVEGEVFLMNWQSGDSLDGRYFGPLPAISIVGHAVPLWTFEEP